MGQNRIVELRLRVDVIGTKSDRHLDEECDSGDDAVRRVAEFFDPDDETVTLTLDVQRDILVRAAHDAQMGNADAGAYLGDLVTRALLSS